MYPPAYPKDWRAAGRKGCRTTGEWSGGFGLQRGKVQGRSGRVARRVRIVDCFCEAVVTSRCTPRGSQRFMFLWPPPNLKEEEPTAQRRRANHRLRHATWRWMRVASSTFASTRAEPFSFRLQAGHPPCRPHGHILPCTRGIILVVWELLPITGATVCDGPDIARRFEGICSIYHKKQTLTPPPFPCLSLYVHHPPQPRHSSTILQPLRQRQRAAEGGGVQAPSFWRCGAACHSSSDSFPSLNITINWYKPGGRELQLPSDAFTLELFLSLQSVAPHSQLLLFYGRHMRLWLEYQNYTCSYLLAYNRLRWASARVPGVRCGQGIPGEAAVCFANSTGFWVGGCVGGGGALTRWGYWAPLTRKRHTMPHPAQPQHTNYWAPRTRKRDQQEHRPQRPTESSDPTRCEGKNG